MKHFFILIWALLIGVALNGQESSDILELNWINLKTFQENLASSQDAKTKKAVVIYANEIETGEVSAVHRYRYKVNCPKNVYIFANKINFTGKLNFLLPGAWDPASTTNPVRDGGNLVIFAQKANFTNMDVLQVSTYGQKAVSKGEVTETIDAFDLNEGGAGGSVYLVFHSLSFDDARFMANALNSFNAEMKEIEKDGGQIDTSGSLSDWKKEILEEDQLIEIVFNDDFRAKYKDEIEVIRRDFRKEVNALNSWKEVMSFADGYMKTFIFNISLFYAKKSLEYSKDFTDLNKREKSQFQKYFSVDFLSGFYNDKIPLVTGNTFLTYKGIQGNDFAVRDGRTYYGPPNAKKPAFQYSTDINSFTRQHTDLEQWAGQWAILMLKDIKLKLEIATKNADYAGILQLIGDYINLPDITVSRPSQVDEYTKLLTDITALRDKFKSKIIPERDNSVQVIENETINFYALPGFTLTKNYWVNGKEKLGILLPNLEEKSFNLSFSVKLAAKETDARSTRALAIAKGGKYAGMLADWTIESFEMPEGVDEENCSIKKQGDLLSIRLGLKNEDRVPLALLFGNGNFMIKLKCVSNLDKNYKFELTLPVNFRYRISNDVSLVNGISVQNSRDNEITLIGLEDLNNDLVAPMSIQGKQTAELKTKIQPLRPWNIENSMATGLTGNYRYFEDLTNGRLFIKNLEITNNFPLLNNGVGFEEMEVTVLYSNGEIKKEVKLFFTKPRETQTIPLVYLQNEANFELRVKVRYENQTLNFPPKVFSQWNIILDGGQLGQ